ncbi:MAG: SEC-C domain-containing protein [Deltaproteobacteria bacterium]|jgi:tetratricopeptide (TPR) repeat protein|nr:SEC-C domain-containing protein [Deltaproteobacteria bacterium]MDL1986477.1 SEC-C domain-containing protein [Deltaproteobacteria bacterium]
MARIPAKFMAAYHEPGRNNPCICGSGMKFKKCCLGAYSSKASELFRNAYNTGDYDEALIRARNWFTWYALSHKAHTIPLLQSDRDAGENMLQIDIEALAELLENLHLCYYRLKRNDEFIEVIERVRNVVQDKRWDAKIAYTRGLWYSVDRNDDEAAYDALQSIDLRTCYDPDILSLYLQVCSAKLTLTESVEIIDRILSSTQKESVRLQYRVVKAINYYLVCQQADGDRLLEEAISKFSSLPAVKKSSYGKLKFAYALEIYGKTTNQQKILEQGREAAIDLIHEANEEHFTAIYKADLHRLLGDFDEGLGNHHNAIKAFSISLELNPSELTKVFLARSLCNDGQCNEAKKLLESIDDTILDKPGKFDLAISWAIVAATSLNVSDLGEAKARLKTIEAHDPVFIQLRDRWMIDLLEATPKSEPGKIRRLIRSLNNYLLLNPNFFGIGININRIIDDADSTIQNKKG